MKLLEKDIEDILYKSPWLLDERFEIPNIKGQNKVLGRQINIGKAGISRYIDLLFKDTRDNRPVVIELKKGELLRENIAQILEYRSLIVSMDEDMRDEWKNEFGLNYYCPKLMLIGMEATDEIIISANLAGIEVRTLKGIQNLEINFNSINEINNKLSDWDAFLKSGNRSLEDRDEWVPEKFEFLKETIEEYGNDKVTTTKKICTTSDKDSWLIDKSFPFINFQVFYKDNYLAGIYEYYDAKTLFSNEYIYFDFVIQEIFNVDTNDENRERIEKIKNESEVILKQKGYDLMEFEDGAATIKILRSNLEDENIFKKTFIKLINDAVFVNDEITGRYMLEE